MTVSLEMAKKRLSHRKDIVLCDNFYFGWSKLAKFYDHSEKDYFKAIPRNILKYNSGHPNRGVRKRKQTNTKKYGVDNPLKSKQIQDKIKKTMLNLYGVDNPTKNRIKFRIKETGEPLKDWLDKQKEPKPAYISMTQFFTVYNVPEYDAKKYLFRYRTFKTNLEEISENLFNRKHYNKKPKKINKICRPDFKLSESVFVNVDGLYWHSEKQKNNYYHFNIRQEFEKNGLRIIQFREDEIRDKPEICKSIVNSAINSASNKIYANKCVAKNVAKKEAKIFLNNNHLLGNINVKHIGLYYNKQIVSLLSYKEEKHMCKIERFCSLVNHNIVECFSKLLEYLEKYCLKSTTTEIHSWVDLKYETGKCFLNTGFIYKKDKLDWKWTDYKNTFNKLKCHANMDNRKLTQKQYADELKWSKIYDAGQRLFIKEL